MSRRDELRLSDIAAALSAITAYTDGVELQGVVYDAVRMRLIEIGEAVKDLAPELRELEPEIPWSSIAQMRDRLTHRYFDTDHAIVADVVDNELGALGEAVDRLRAR